MPICLATTQNKNLKKSRSAALEFQGVAGISMVFQDLCLFQDFPGLEFRTIKFQNIPGSLGTLILAAQFNGSTWVSPDMSSLRAEHDCSELAACIIAN